MTAPRAGLLLLPLFAALAVSALSLEDGAPHALPAVSAPAPFLVSRNVAPPKAAPVAAAAPAVAPAPAPWTQREMLNALRFVESSDRVNPPDGDGGRALGPYQIRVRYWRDAVAANPSLASIRENGRWRPARHEDCRKAAYAEDVVRAFMGRHAAEAWRTGAAEIVARIHNGGPEGARKKASLPYWARVQTALASARR